MKNVIDHEFVVNQIESFRQDPVARIVQNAVSAQGVDAVSLDREVINRLDDSVSEKLDTWAVTHQKMSGRCWEFAGLNVLRPALIRELNLEDFQFSQNYVAFFDKLEKANHVLARAIKSADLPMDDEFVRTTLKDFSDGGFWTQFVDLVRKYGLVPVWAMPDTESSGNTDQMNRSLAAVLRRAVQRIRAAAPDEERIDEIQSETMTDVWRVLSIHLGTPPTSFNWQYRDKDKTFHAHGSLTPLEFAEKYVPADLAEYVVLTHDPRAENPVGRTYALDGKPYMEGGTAYVHLSASLEDLKAAAVQTIRSGEPVWFGCDVKKQFDKAMGIWDARLHDYEALYGINLNLDKADRLRFRDTSLSHAMTFVGVDLEDGQPRRWRVENSWGDEVGKKGFFTMDDSWFDDFVFQVIIPPKHLTDAQLAAAKADPIVLPEWDALN